jgi:Spy/CpxP family protein refolding chaperone
MNRRTMFGVITGALVTLGVGAAALVGGRAYAHGPGGPHAGMMKRMVSAALDEALDRANVTADQRTAIHGARDRAFAAIAAQHPDRRAQRDQVLALFEGDRLDAAQLQAVHAQMEQQRQAVHAAVTQAIVEIHDALTPDQRKVVAEYARSFGPGRMR